MSPFQNLKMAFKQEPFVRGGSPSHSLMSSWVLQNCEKSNLLGQTFLVKIPLLNFEKGIFFCTPYQNIEENENANLV